MPNQESALIVGAGSGLSAALARLFKREGMQIALAARDTGKLAPLANEIGARVYACDASSPDDITTLFAALVGDSGAPDVVVYNPSARAPGPVSEIDPDQVKRALMISCYGGFLVGQAAARLMLARGSGSILFTGATASVKGFANSAAFAMGKFGLRGLAQSMARELAPKNIHVAHFVIDGAIAKGDDDPRTGTRGADDLLRPEAIADAYLYTHRQHRSAWTWEIELRPWIEKF